MSIFSIKNLHIEFGDFSLLENIDFEIYKKDRVGMALKMYFTDSGKKKESRYLRSLRKKIWYRNDEWKYDADIVARTAQKYYGENTFGG